MPSMDAGTMDVVQLVDPALPMTIFSQSLPLPRPHHMVSRKCVCVDVLASQPHSAQGEGWAATRHSSQYFLPAIRHRGTTLCLDSTTP